MNIKALHQFYLKYISLSLSIEYRRQQLYCVQQGLRPCVIFFYLPIFYTLKAEAVSEFSKTAATQKASYGSFDL